MQYRREITLNLSGRNEYKYITAKQGDNESRYITVTLECDRNTLYMPEEGVTAVFRCIKPDGHSCLNPATLNQDGTVTVELSNQVLAVAGTVRADISLIKGDAVLSAANFFIHVEEAPLSADTTVSSDEFGLLNEMIKDARDAADAAYEALENANGFQKEYTVATDGEVQAMLTEVFSAA